MEGLSSKQEGHEVARVLSLKKGGDVNLLTGGVFFKRASLLFAKPSACYATGL